MASLLYPILFYSTIAGLATVAGMALLLYRESFARQNSSYFVSFAAGVLMATAFFHLIPESAELYPFAYQFVLAGFLVFYLLEHVFLIHAGHEEDTRAQVKGSIATTGLGFHSLLDGVAIGAGFEISPSIGFITTLAVILHEFPEGISTLSVLFNSKMERGKAILYTMIVAVATPVGAVLTFFFLKGIGTDFLGMLIAFSAGSFLYIASADLIPETHLRPNKLNAVVLLSGVVLIYFISLLVTA
ncbi:ZIP family metal transporter [Candidatus Micrarchaeota archaeon]|nr:ZIP family metal transporter [Candidatus Micrarchaeota archaeon]